MLNLERIREKDQFAKLIGAQMVEADDGKGVVTLTVQPHHLNALDIVQGGVIFTLADLAFALASNSRGLPAVALSASIHYLRPGRLGSTLTATARELTMTHKVGTYLVDVTDESGVVLASFQGLAFRKTPKPPSPQGTSVQIA